MNKFFLYILFFLIISRGNSQTTVFKENNKWGIKESSNTLIKPIHDTIFNFDSTGKVCLACEKIRGSHPNKFIKAPVFTYHCYYLNKKGEHLVIEQEGGDTTGTFTLLKTSVAKYIGNDNFMTVSVKDKSSMDHKHLVNKDFKQFTKKGYEDVHMSADPQFIIAKKRFDGNVIYEGLINLQEEEVLPFRYSHIKFNTKDSMIIGCTAGQGASSEDDIFDYKAKKINSYHKHIELATKKFVILKVFSPKEFLIVMNLETKEEKVEYAEEAHYYADDKILMMHEEHWYVYDIITHKKKPYDIKHKK